MSSDAEIIKWVLVAKGGVGSGAQVGHIFFGNQYQTATSREKPQVAAGGNPPPNNPFEGNSWPPLPTANGKPVTTMPDGHSARDFDPKQTIAQIGRMNIAAISGGRVHTITDAAGKAKGLELPVGRGYSVRVFLHDNDTYTVQRVYSRAGKQTVKGQESDIYADEVGEKAYQASSFVNVPFGKHNP
jgi:hypothetical protein